MRVTHLQLSTTDHTGLHSLSKDTWQHTGTVQIAAVHQEKGQRLEQISSPHTKEG